MTYLYLQYLNLKVIKMCKTANEKHLENLCIPLQYTFRLFATFMFLGSIEEVHVPDHVSDGLLYHDM